MIRPAEPPDLDALTALWEALNRDGNAADARYRPYPDGRTWFRGYARAIWFAKDPFPGAFVAVADDQLVGFVAGTLIPPHPALAPVAGVLITDMYVAPKLRRTGVGRRLVAAFTEAAARAGYTGVEVGTLIRDARAVGFWRGLGFADMRVTLVRAG